MITDADTHISSPAVSFGIRAEELIRRMDHAGVDQALVWLQPPPDGDVPRENAYVAEKVKQYPTRLLGFGWTDPHLGAARAKDEIRRCVKEYGFYGVKLNGAQNNFRIDDEKIALPLIAEIARLGTAAAFHIGTDAVDNTHPFRLAKIAKRFPQLRILAVHMGGVAFHDVSAAMIEAAQDCPNISLVGSAVRAVNIVKAIQVLGAKRVCFGSDSPFALMHVELAMYRALMQDELNPVEQADILGGNIARFLKGDDKS